MDFDPSRISLSYFINSLHANNTVESSSTVALVLIRAAILMFLMWRIFFAVLSVYLKRTFLTSLSTMLSTYISGTLHRTSVSKLKVCIRCLFARITIICILQYWTDVDVVFYCRICRQIANKFLFSSNKHPTSRPAVPHKTITC